MWKNVTDWKTSLIVIPCLFMLELLREKAISVTDLAVFTPIAVAYLGLMSNSKGDGK